MSDIYKIQYNGMTLAYPGWNGYVGYDNVPAFKTLTLCASEGGTVTASVLTGLPGDTVTLTPTYNTYYRFNNYSVTGGTIAGNTFTFGNEDATVQANFKVNYFTATGGYEKGSNVSAYGQGSLKTTNIPAKYATASYKTDNVPASWYATSNRWKPNGASAYSITLHPIMKFSAGNGSTTNEVGTGRAISLIGSTSTQTATLTMSVARYGGTKTAQYNKTFTSNVQNVNYGISGNVAFGANRSYGTAMYVATGTTGTWTATGIAP